MIASRFNLYVMFAAVLVVGVAGFAGAVNAAGACAIDIHNASETCSSLSEVSVLSPVNAQGQTVMKFSLDPQITSAKELQFDIAYDQIPAGFSFNIGDSQSSNGYGGDSGHQSRDAEIHLIKKALVVYGSDHVSPGDTLDNHRLVARENFALTTNDMPATFSIIISDEEVQYRLPGQSTYTKITGDYLFAFDGQQDNEGPVNYDVYVAFNRVVGGSYRSGSGVSGVAITLNDTKTSPVNTVQKTTGPTSQVNNNPGPVAQTVGSARRMGVMHRITQTRGRVAGIQQEPYCAEGMYTMWEYGARIIRLQAHLNLNMSDQYLPDGYFGPNTQARLNQYCTQKMSE